MSSKISSPDSFTATCNGKFIDVNILPPITESKTINKEIIVHVLKVHLSDEGIRLYTASCEVFRKRNMLNNFLKVIISNKRDEILTNKRSKLKSFVLFTILEDTVLFLILLRLGGKPMGDHYDSQKETSYYDPK